MIRKGLAEVLDRHVVYSISNQLLITGTNFLVGIIAARVLGVADFGLFSLILMMSLFAGNIEHTLLTMPMLTVAGKRQQRSPSYFAAIARIGLVTALASAAVIALFVGVYAVARSEPVSLALIASAAAMTFANNVQLKVRFILFANKRSALTVALEALRVGIIIAGGIAIYLWDVPITVANVFWLFAVASLISVLPVAADIFSHRVRRDLVKRTLGRHWPMSRWMLLMLLVAIGQEQALWVITGLKLGDEAVGGLRAAQYLLGVTHFLLFAFENYMPRRAAEEMRRGGVQRLVRYLTYQSVLLGGVCALIILPVVIFPETLLGLVFGEEYVAYAATTPIFAIAYVCIIQRVIWIYYLRTVEQTRSIFHSYVGSSITSLIVIFPAIHYLGVAGAAWCIAIAQIACLSFIAASIAQHYERAVHGRNPSAARTMGRENGGFDVLTGGGRAPHE